MGFAMVAGTGSVTPVDSLTDSTGTAHGDYASPRVPGVDRVRAWSGAISAELDIETAFVDPGAPGGTIVSYPNPFHPGEQPVTLAWKLSDNATVRLRIYTVSGQLVLDREFAPGTEGGRVGLNTWPWDGRNGEGRTVASGGYVVLVEAQGTGETLHVMRRKIAAVR
jgi:hypothetical protein